MQVRHEMVGHLKPAKGRPCIPAFLVASTLPASIYSILFTFCLLFYAATQVRLMCPCIFENHACVRQNVSCSSSACSTPAFSHQLPWK